MSEQVSTAALRALLDKATKRPWGSSGVAIFVDVSVLRVEDLRGSFVANTNSMSDAALIAAAVNALPALLDEVDALREGFSVGSPCRFVALLS